MDQSLLQASAGCVITGNAQTLFAALMPGNRITRAAVSAFTESRNGNAYRLAATMNPAAGIYAARREMYPCERIC